jgi:hypothetical protein
MRTRRLPTGGLAALAVLLAALAVVVVAGAPVPRAIVERVTTTSLARHHHVGTSRQLDNRPAGTSTDVAVDGPGIVHRTLRTAPPTRRAPSRPSTTSPTPPTTTTTTTPVTATTTVHPSPTTSRGGVFEGGRTTATAWLGAVRTVTVLVPDGVRVTLSVTCGFVGSRPATSFTSVTVRVQGGSAACVATFAVPTSSPQPAPWRLITS